ncbi:MAG: protein kinase domain-containing protein [Sphingomonadaceae bacterium]
MTEKPAGVGPGQQVGKYKLVKSLGRGTSGTVYRAYDTFTGKEVALKIVDPAIFEDPDFGSARHAQFLAEASLAGMLIHPHVVTLLDAVVEQDRAYIAMELITGGDLSQHVKPDTLLPVADVIEICYHCCSALDYTTRAGIIHCDIKPANIMIADGTDVRITDFGAAVLHKSKVVQAAAMGSPHYAAPERITREELTFHSDMYSLGVVLYELLTGRRPFLAANIDELVEKILHEEPPPPSSLRPDLSPIIDRAVMHALKKKPEQRYRTWAEFAFELSEVSRHVLSPDAVPEADKLNALKRVEVLESLSDEELWEIARAGRWSRVKADDVLVSEDDTGSHFFLLAAGSAKVVRRERLLNLVKAGEFFGEMAYILDGQQRRQASVVATKDGVIAEFAPDALNRMSLEAQLLLTRALARNLAERLTLANTRITG